MYAERWGRTPGWSTPAGFPATWRHFVVAMQHVNAEHSRESLRRYYAESMVWAKNKADADRWLQRHKLQAGWM